MTLWLQCKEYKDAVSRQPLDRDTIDLKLNQVADQYVARDEVLDILKCITRYKEGSIYFAGEQILVQQFVTLHRTFQSNPQRQGHKLQTAELWEFLKPPVEVEQSGRSTRGGPATSDHSRTDYDHF